MNAHPKVINDSHIRPALEKEIDQVFAAFAPMLPPPTILYLNTIASAPVRTMAEDAGNALLAIRNRVDALKTLLDTTAASYVKVWQNPDLVNEAKIRQTTELLDTARTAAAAHVDVVTKNAATIRQSAITGLYRQPSDLTGIERRQAMLTPILDRLDRGDAVLARMEQELSRAFIGGDAVMVWLLTGDEFPRLYLEGRGMSEFHQGWLDLAPSVVAAVGNESARRAKALFDLCEHERHGLAVLVLCVQYLANLLDT